jgi:hypothetical protein
MPPGSSIMIAPDATIHAAGRGPISPGQVSAPIPPDQPSTSFPPGRLPAPISPGELAAPISPGQLRDARLQRMRLR